MRGRHPAGADWQATDLSVSATAESIEVNNAWFGWSIPAAGRGGLPAAVRFNHNGDEDRALHWIDRVAQDAAS